MLLKVARQIFCVGFQLGTRLAVKRQYFISMMFFITCLYRSMCMFELRFAVTEVCDLTQAHSHLGSS